MFHVGALRKSWSRDRDISRGLNAEELVQVLKA